MTATELAKLLLKYPEYQVLLRVGNDWVEVWGVTPTGGHRNAVTILATNPALGGSVIVVEPDA